MKFSLGDATHTGNGIRNIFQALSQAPMVREQHRQQAQLRDAQTYSSNMSGNKHGAEAERERFTLGQRQAVPDVAPEGMSQHQYFADLAFKKSGDTNAERLARAASEYQTQGIRDQAVSNIDNVDRMNRFNTLAKPGETYEPYKAVGNTGRAINGATGFGRIVDEALAGGFDRKTNSEIGENNAQAGSANASAAKQYSGIRVDNAQIGEIGARTGKVKLESERLQAGGSGKPLTAAQLRENAAVKEAREIISAMPQEQLDALNRENTQFMSAQQKMLFNTLQRANKPMFGEMDIPTIAAQPAAPPPVAEPSLLDNTLDKVEKVKKWFTVPDPRPAAKSAAPTPAPSNIKGAGERRIGPDGTIYERGTDGKVRVVGNSSR